MFTLWAFQLHSTARVTGLSLAAAAAAARAAGADNVNGLSTGFRFILIVAASEMCQKDRIIFF
jgi:hypothetical protein